MAIVLIRGTNLAPSPKKPPLNRSFIYAVGFMYLVAFHVPLHHFTGTGLELPSNVMSWISVSFCISIGLLQSIRTKKVRYSKLSVGLLLCCILMTFPVVYSQSSFEGSIYRILALWGGFLLFLSIQQFIFSNKQKNRLIWFIVLACLLEGAIAYCQILTSENLSTVNLWGVFPTANTFATFLSTGLLASGYLLCRHLKKYQKQVSIASLLYLTPLVCIPLIILTLSLIGWSSAILGICIIFPYLYRFASRKRLWGWSASTATGIILGISTLCFFHPQPFHPDGLKGIEHLKVSLEQTSDMFIEKPFTGYGYGQFEEEYVLYSARQHQLNQSYPAPQPALTHPSNEILYWGIEGGILPVLAMLLAVLFILLRIYYAKSKTRLATLSLLFPIALHSQLDNVFALSSIHWITFVILLFWTDQRVAKYKNIDLKPIAIRLIHIIIYILPATTCCYMGGVLATQYALSQYKSTHDRRWLNIINHPFIWEDSLMQARLAYALKKTETKQLDSFKPWLLNLIRREPRPEYYHSLINLYQKMGDINHAEQTRLEALYLFPDFEVQAIQKKTELQNKRIIHN
ncbi:PglL family O-oligosaccharyltransferase [Vibrio quintilis]|uniref:Virulence factor membrane-bound polymerase C-terminal domain-containing protein n=1 Tax=Vibrio quintilis TaxID=1117707 RepID=A0A1M7YSR9_9VIBR|nr:Wzy polymerase domain-containing protein [Vibrio quintilis]SHO55586.1 hypothetical protein VQ7734_01323 [Vibrio quintilis]